MNQDLALRVLSQIMAWSDERAGEEFRWLRLMARLKYDGYRDFQAGMRFIESLATWLQQFSAAERETAYGFVRTALVYVGPGEMHRLVEQLYPRHVRHQLLQMIAKERNIAPYRVLADAGAKEAARRLRRQTLFMGLSDGARIDGIRHANAGLLSNEQLVIATQVDRDKWRDLLDSLRTDLGDQEARFRLVYLIDDFAGTGTSLLRFNKEKNKWSGKLVRFYESYEGASATISNDSIFADDWVLRIHHYVASHKAAASIAEQASTAGTQFAKDKWPKDVSATFGTILPESLPIDHDQRYAGFVALARDYYDPTIRTKHTDVGGAQHMGLGYGACALPLILEHNTPNNSVALLWAETDGRQPDGTSSPAMRPLFRRRQRHS